MTPMNVAHVLRATLTNAAHFAAQNHLRGTSETTRLRPKPSTALSRLVMLATLTRIVMSSMAIGVVSPVGVVGDDIVVWPWWMSRWSLRFEGMLTNSPASRRCLLGPVMLRTW